MVIFISGMLTTRMMTKTYHQAPFAKLETAAELHQEAHTPHM